MISKTNDRSISQNDTVREATSVAKCELRHCTFPLTHELSVEFRSEQNEDNCKVRIAGCRQAAGRQADEWSLGQSVGELAGWLAGQLRGCMLSSLSPMPLLLMRPALEREREAQHTRGCL